jgi:hypothetical protein
MTNLIGRTMLAGLAVVATIVVVWSMSTFPKLKLVGKGEATDASATSPSEIMEWQGWNRYLPVEYWVHPF